MTFSHLKHLHGTIFKIIVLLWLQKQNTVFAENLENGEKQQRRKKKSLKIHDQKINPAFY